MQIRAVEFSTYFYLYYLVSILCKPLNVSTTIQYIIHYLILNLKSKKDRRLPAAGFRMI